MILTRFRHAFLIAAFLAAVPFGVLETHALDGLKRTELRRVDLTGTQGTEVITSILEAAPGAGIPRHTHHGDEFLYVLEGGTIEVPGKAPMHLKTGDTLHFPRGLAHGGFTVVGDAPIKALTIHVVDKGKPLMVPVE